MDCREELVQIWDSNTVEEMDNNVDAMCEWLNRCMGMAR